MYISSLKSIPLCYHQSQSSTMGKRTLSDVQRGNGLMGAGRGCGIILSFPFSFLDQLPTMLKYCTIPKGSHKYNAYDSFEQTLQKMKQPKWLFFPANNRQLWVCLEPNFLCFVLYLILPSFWDSEQKWGQELSFQGILNSFSGILLLCYQPCSHSMSLTSITME